jgi:predicted nucleotidyltransferase
VDAAVRVWAGREAAARPEVLRLGYFGSYATGQWGVGSDVDLVAVVARANRPFLERARDWDLTDLPVPAEILIYTQPEWLAVLERGDRFAQVMRHEVIWVVSSPEEPRQPPRV